MNKALKIVLAIFLFIIIAVLAGSWYLSKHWRPILNERLQVLVSSSSDSLYTLTYDDLEFSWYRGYASLTNVALKPNQAVFDRMKADSSAPDNQYSIQVSSVEIKNFHPSRLYRQQKLNIDNIILVDPVVSVINETMPKKDIIEVKDQRTLYQKISKLLKEIRVDNFNVNNLTLTYQNNNTDDSVTTRLKNINLQVSDILLDSLSGQDTSRIYYSKGVHFKMKNYRIATRDSLYHVNLSDIDFSTAAKEFKIERVALVPRYNKDEFYEMAAKPTERFELSFDSLLIQGIDIPRLLESQQFRATKISTSGGDMEVAANTNYPKPVTDKRGKDPHQQILKLAWNFGVDTLHLGNMNIVYEELSKVTQQRGKISFNNSEISLYNITNDSLLLSRSPHLKADVRTKFMNAASLDVHFDFNMLSEIGAFQYHGKLGAMNGRVLNQVLKPLAQIEINSADIRSLAFNFKIDQRKSVGTVDFRYDNLKVKLLMLEDKGAIISKRKLASSLATTVIINSSNPDGIGKYTRGNVYYNRPQSYAFFKIIWKSLFQGIKTSAGVSEEREAKLKNTAKDTKRAAKKVGSFIKGIFKKKEE